MSQDHGSQSTHDALFFLLSEMVGLERQMKQLKPAQIRRELCSFTSRLSEFLPEIEELEELEDRIGTLEQRLQGMNGGGK